MSAERFSVGKEFVWNNALYRVIRLLPGNVLTIENMATGSLDTVELTKLITALFANELTFQTPAIQDKFTYAYDDLDECPSDLRQIAEYRLSVIKSLLGHRLTRAIISQRVAEVQASYDEIGNQSRLKNAISVSSIYRWIRAYERSGHDIRSLIPSVNKRGATGQSRLESEVELVIQGVIKSMYLVRERVTIGDLHHEIAVSLHEENLLRNDDDQLKTPSASTVGRRLRQLDAIKIYQAKHGKRASRQKYRQYGRFDYPNTPLTRVEIDHTVADLIVVDEHDNLPLGRFTITYAIDVATRYPLGLYLGFEPPSFLTVAECLYHAILPKSTKEKFDTEHEWLAFGIPELLKIDNGREFVGRDLDDACAALGIEIERTPARMPHLKAAIERLFGTMNTGILHQLPGTTRSNITQRGDYNSVKMACISLSDVERIIHTYIVDIYAQNFHAGLEGIPAKRWQTAIDNGFTPRLPASSEELKILLGRIDYRSIHAYGIEFQSLRYNTSELAQLRAELDRAGQRQVKIKYHPADLSRIYVYHQFDDRYLEVPALAVEYTAGLSLWKHKVIRNMALHEHETVDLVALGRAKRRIQEIVESSRERKTSGRSKIARWENGGGAETDEAGDEFDGVFFDLDLELSKNTDGWEIGYVKPST